MSEQAKILYKEWFIDFGPFEGEMPGDWHLGTVEEIIELHDSKRKPLSGREMIWRRYILTTGLHQSWIM